MKILVLILVSFLFLHAKPYRGLWDEYFYVKNFQPKILMDTTNLPKISYDGPHIYEDNIEDLVLAEQIREVVNFFNEDGANIGYAEEDVQYLMSIKSIEFEVTFSTIIVNTVCSIIRLSDNATITTGGTYSRSMGKEERLIETSIAIAIFEFYKVINSPKEIPLSRSQNVNQ